MGRLNDWNGEIRTFKTVRTLISHPRLLKRVWSGPFLRPRLDSERPLSKNCVIADVVNDNHGASSTTSDP